MQSPTGKARVIDTRDNFKAPALREPTSYLSYSTAVKFRRALQEDRLILDRVGQDAVNLMTDTQPYRQKTGIAKRTTQGDFRIIGHRIRFLESIPPQWGALRQLLFDEFGDPNKDGEMLRATSPLFHADKIRKPLLVLQGANDPRVPKVESDEIVEAVRKKGGTVEYILFPDEGHSFSKKINEVRANKAILAFLDTYLKGMRFPT